MNLEYLLSNKSYQSSRLLTLDEFVKLCKLCGLPAEAELLEFFEQKKLFFPFARIKYPWRSPYDSKGWTRVFNWHGDQPQNWHENGLLWVPENRRFLSWKHFDSANHEAKYESFYSRFQIYHFHQLSSHNEFSLSIKTLLSPSKRASFFLRRRRKWAQESLINLRSQREDLQRICWLCQCLSNRYHPEVRTNLRKITITLNDGSFDWYEYCRNWKAQKELSNLNITLTELKNIQQRLTWLSSSIDPVSRWHDLITFIDYDKREQLSGDAQLAQQYYAMEMMIRRFYNDLTGKHLPAPYYHSLTASPYNHGVRDEKSSLPYLKYTANRYSVNPQPKLIMICEGKSEVNLYSFVLKDIFGRSPEVLGISFMDIGGVGNAVGSKDRDRRMALKHLIDYQHHVMTIVFVALDDEGGSRGMMEDICKKRSIWDSDRMVTCSEYTRIWKPSLEFANFSPQEIAMALNRVAKSPNLFSENDVATASSPKGDFLSALFKEKIKAYDLCKPDLAIELAKILADKCLKGESPYKSERPIFKTIRRIIWMCSWHSLPNSMPEEENSRGFWFGQNSKIRDQRYRDWLNESLIDS